MLCKVLFLMVILNPVAQALSLQEALKVSFERNPKTRANDLMVEAMQDHARAAW
jgi:hypothetical protein